MKFFLRLTVLSFVALATAGIAENAKAQTANTGVVLGTITDPGGAVIPDATVDLTNSATNETKTITTNSSGQYTFPNVAPGSYTLKCAKQGFATMTIGNIKVDVTKSYTYDLKLEIRSSQEIVEVSALTQAELQTADAVVGNVVGGNALMHLPTLQRDSRELLTLQPGSTPYETSNGGGFGDSGGTVAGARSDQNAFNLDGIDITDNVIAGGGNQVPIVPIGVESIDEFRVGVTNNNASFGRASGGQINVVSKGGTNNFHGSAYWYHQNSALNANSWDNNTNKIKKPADHDNRGGFSFGGPLKKDKTFFFGNYEFRRFPQSVQVIRIMPSDTLRNGVLIFGGTPYNLNLANGALASNCGPSGTSPCDPRGIGISPTIEQLWKMMPKGNDLTLGDGVNTVGLRTSVAAPLKDDSINFRLDHNFTQKIKFFGRYMYHRNLTPNANGEFAGQIDLRGATAVNSSSSNLRGDGFTSGLDWQLTNSLTNSFRAGWIRSRQDFVVIRPSVSAGQLALPGTDSSLGPVALAPALGATGFLDTIIDVDTQRARHQAIYDSNKQYVDTISWVKGKHAIAAGGDVRWLPTIHDRDDKVIGSLNSLVATLDADVTGTLNIPDTNRPAGLSAADATKWDRLYAASLGLINNVGILAVRDGSLQPKPLGATLIARTTLRSYNFFAQDTWRIKPSLTVTYGLAYGWQTTPHEQDQQQTLIANHDNGDQILNGFDYIRQKQQAAVNGDIFNPTLSYVPIKDSGRSDVFNVDYGNWAPRVSAAWNPSVTNGFLGRMFGDRKTVVRGGYGIAYDRVNTVQSVIIPMLGVGFAQTINIKTPGCNASGTPGANCGVDTTPGGSIFRIGVDGQVPTPPTPSALKSPVVPADGLSEILSFQNDPDFQVGRSHMVDFTIQRSLPGQMIFEAGYVGRFARHLANSINFNSTPYFFKDKTSGQTFAQAFDTVATELRNGQPVTNQPWFENQLPNLQTLSAVGSQFGIFSCPTATSATTCMVQNSSAAFQQDLVSSLFLTMDLSRAFLLGVPAYDNTQVLELFTRTSRDKSNYNALVLTLRNNNWHGLFFDFNYTFSKSLDTVGAVQNDARYYSSSFDTNLDYGTSFFDRPHVFNAIFNYELPFGKERFSSSHSSINKTIGGWYTAGIFRKSSGVPELVTISGQSFGGGLDFGTQAGEIALARTGSLGGGSVNNGVAGSVANTPLGPVSVGTAGDPSTGGTGLNYFKNPAAAFQQFRPALLASDTNDGRDNPLRGLGLWNLDMRFGKTTRITEQIKVEFSFDFFNIFNHPNFLDPSFDVTNPANFGVINTQLIPADRISGARWIQFGLRVDF
jgi:Carboxypeptidase regulatory-like domain